MLFKPVIGAELSGSIGGITASHNKGGAYFRNRVVPTNPATPAQGVVRQAMGTLASRWNNTLSPTQRDAWDTYALNVPLLNRLGESVNVTGLNMFQRSNIPRLQNGLPRVDDAPTVFNLGDFSAPTIASFTSPTAMSLNFTEADGWVSEDDAAMIIYGSRQQNQSILFFKGPYRQYVAQLLGASGVPPTSPFAGVHPFPVAAGNKAFIKLSVTRADGRLSQVQRLVAVAI